MSVYENTDPQFDSKVMSDEGRPLLALVMMLKNEAHTIKSTIDSVKAGIDRWYILDTGSTDGTQQKIKDEFGDKVPGQLFNGTFVDYGSTRNDIIDRANSTFPRPVFLLMMSADETMDDIMVVRRFLSSVRFSRGTMHEAYGVTIGGGVTFETCR